MKIRDAVLDQTHTFTQPALTWTFPINIVDPVTEFKIHIRAKTHQTQAPDAPWEWPGPMPYLISEIAIIDGSEVIFALNGAQCVAVSCFDLGYAPFHIHEEAAARWNEWCFPIHFGRSLVDPNWIFDPQRFRNPQIRITWNLAALQVVGAGAWADPAVTPIEITVWAKIMEEGADPVGYFMTKEVKQYNMAAAGNEITYLPTDFPIRKLMVRQYLFGSRMSTMVTHLKLSQDQDKWIPFDLNGNDFIRLMKNWFTEVQFNSRHWMANDEQREHLSGDLSSGIVVSNALNTIVAGQNWVGNAFFAYVSTDAGAFVAPVDRRVVQSMSMTRTPFDTFCYPFGDQGDPVDWLEVGPMGNLRLILTHAIEDFESADGYGTTEVFVQQAHPY